MSDSIEMQREALYSAVGKALSAWNSVEWGVCSLFSCCVTHDIGNAEATKAFWAIVSFEAKLKMADAAIRERFTRFPDYLPCWNKSHNRLTAQSKKRNKIAHATVMEFNWDSAAGRQSDVCLAPYFFSFRSIPKADLTKSVRWFDPRPSDRLYASDITRFAKAFRLTDERISRLTTHYVQTGILPKYLKREDAKEP